MTVSNERCASHQQQHLHQSNLGSQGMAVPCFFSEGSLKHRFLGLPQTKAGYCHVEWPFRHAAKYAAG